MEETITEFDVIVVGHGVSGLSAGLAAHEAGATPVILEKSPKEDRGGHTRFAGGAFRTPIEDPQQVEDDLDLDASLERYTKNDFYSDLMDVSNNRADPDLCDVLVNNAYETIQWLTGHGLEWRETFSDETGYGTTRGAVQAEWEGFERGKAVVEVLADRAEELGIQLHYLTEMRELVTNNSNEVTGVIAHAPNEKIEYDAPAVILCAGAYVSNPEKRTRYFGRDGDAYVVRGSRYNTGEALDAAIEAGALPGGQWGGAHQVLLDANAPPIEGGRTRINGYQYSVLLNERGDRYVDEGEDFLLKTYAKMGQRLYDQPHQIGFVIFDSKVNELVMSQHGSDPLKAETLEELFAYDDVRVDTERALETISNFNDACDPDNFDPDALDGNATIGLEINKSNWALPVDEPPYYCFVARPGVTFAFGGLKITPDANVLSTQNEPLTGLWAVGNSTSEFFYGNYPGGSALTRGATFGRRAGTAAAEFSN